MVKWSWWLLNSKLQQKIVLWNTIVFLLCCKEVLKGFPVLRCMPFCSCTGMHFGWKQFTFFQHFICKTPWILSLYKAFKWSLRYKLHRRVLHLVDISAVGYTSHFELFGFECFFYYVWILDFLWFGSNTADERILVDMYI